MFAAFALALTTALAPPRLEAEKPVPPTPGAQVANFTLKDVHRRPRALDDFKDKKALVIVFIGKECPLCNLYLPSLIELHKEYASKGVQFLAIDSNAQDMLIDVAAHAEEREIPFTVLKDFDHAAADALGARHGRSP